MNQNQEKIMEYCYARSIDDLIYSIPIRDILETETFNQLNIRILIRDLNDLENEELIKLDGNFPLDNLEFLSLRITLTGLLTWEEKNPNLQPYFTELTRKFLNFVQDVELERIELQEGEGAQYGFLPFSEVTEILEETSHSSIVFIMNKSDSIFTQRIGFTRSKGIIFYGENEPFLTIEGVNYLSEHAINEDDLVNNEKYGLEINRIDQGTILCKFPGDAEYITLKHIADFNSILPDFYAVAGMQLDNENQIWYSKELYGNQIPVIAESTGLYVEENKENFTEVRELQRTLIIILILGFIFIPKKSIQIVKKNRDNLKENLTRL